MLPEEIIIPGVDKGPDVPPVKVLGSVEQRAGRLDRHGGHGMVRRQVGHDILEGPIEGTLTMEGAFELQVRAVPLMTGLF